MTQFANHYPKQLSGGMKQRINLARGLCVGTKVLLLDEPFAALDEQTRMVLGEDLSILLARTGKTIVFVTHSLAEAVFLADRIVVMTARPGKVKARSTVPHPHPRSPDFMLAPRIRRNPQRALRASCATRSGPRSRACAKRATPVGEADAPRSAFSSARSSSASSRSCSAPGGSSRIRRRQLALLLPRAGTGLARDAGAVVVGAALVGRRHHLEGNHPGLCHCRHRRHRRSGFLVARSKNLLRIFEPMLTGMFAIPLTLFFPLFVVFFGIGPDSKVAYGATYSFFPIALNTIAGFASVDELYLRAVRSMGASGLQQFRHVYLPGAMPVTLTGLRIGFFICIASVLGGETLAAAAGVGKSIALVGRADGNGAALCLDRLRGAGLGHAQPPGAGRRNAQRAGVMELTADTRSAWCASALVVALAGDLGNLCALHQHLLADRRTRRRGDGVVAEGDGRAARARPRSASP